MKQPEDIVWDTITASAKTRFDYAAYEKGFEEVDSDSIAENILFMTIARYASGQSSEDIQSEISTHCLAIGYGVEAAALQQFLHDKEVTLRNEIRAAEVAMALFEQGAKPPGVLMQIRSILKTP